MQHSTDSLHCLNLATFSENKQGLWRQTFDLQVCTLQCGHAVLQL